MSTPNLNAALAKAKILMPAITASREVKIPTKSGRTIAFTYAELEAILQPITPLIGEHGLSLAHQLQFVGSNYFLRTTLRHESGEELDSFFMLPINCADPKDLGSAIAYGRRYNTVCLLDICVVEADDWNETKVRLAVELKKEMNSDRPKPVEKPGSILDDISGTAPYIQKINKAQLERLWAIAKPLSQELCKTIVKSISGVESSKDIPVSKYNLVVNAIEREVIKMTKDQESDPIKPNPPNVFVLTQEVDSLIKRKNISEDNEIAILMELYGIKERILLSDKQLLEFRDYLSLRPSVAMAIAN